jgi:hypothetical protein
MELLDYICTGAKPRGCCGQAIVFTTTQLSLAAEQGFFIR